MGLLQQEASHNIVVFRALQLGDLLCSVPAFRALRAAFPQARISLMGLPWSKNFVTRYSDYLDDFIEFPGWPGLPEQAPQLEIIPDFIKQMQRRQFDLALQMQGNGTLVNSMIMLFGARQTAGYFLPGHYRPDEALFRIYPEGEQEVRIWLSLLNQLGIPSQGEQLEFPITPQERAVFEQFSLVEGLQKDYICLHPGAHSSGRYNLPSDRLAAIGDALAQMGYQVVLTGTADEIPLTQAVARAMHAPVLDVAGKTDLGTLGQLIAGARLVVSHDTGVAHLAAACETPSVILFTISDPNRWWPLNHQLHHAVLDARGVSVEQILAEITTFLKDIGAYVNA